jgi:hypothetical protein
MNSACSRVRDPPGVSEAAALTNRSARCKRPRHGLRAVWLAEIHFQKDRSVLASPLVIASALAAPDARQDRDRRSGPPAEPPTTAGGRRRDGGPHLEEGWSSRRAAACPGTTRASTSRTASRDQFLETQDSTKVDPGALRTREVRQFRTSASCPSRTSRTAHPHRRDHSRDVPLWDGSARRSSWPRTVSSDLKRHLPTYQAA